jgi:hypothetical protein
MLRMLEHTDGKEREKERNTDRQTGTEKRSSQTDKPTDIYTLYSQTKE